MNVKIASRGSEHPLKALVGSIVRSVYPGYTWWGIRGLLRGHAVSEGYTGLPWRLPMGDQRSLMTKKWESDDNFMAMVGSSVPSGYHVNPQGRFSDQYTLGHKKIVV